MPFECIIFEKQAGIATIKLNRPKVLNAMNKQMWEEIQAALADVKADPQTGAVIFTGEGRAFSTGADLKESKTRSPEDYRDYLVALQEASRRIIRFEKPKLTTKTLLFHQARLHGFNTFLFPFKRTLGQELNERLFVE